MPDENQQTTPADNTQTPESTQPIQTDSPAPVTDSTPSDMPPEAPESPTNVVDIPLGKDGNGAGVQQPAESKEWIPSYAGMTDLGEKKPEELPPSASLPEETPPASQTQTLNSAKAEYDATVQMGGNEPIKTQSFIRGLLEKAKLAIQRKKRKKLDKIMSMFLKQASITNDEVEKYLHISDATATRYLSILVKEGKIKQNGKTGKSVSYTKTN
jgi:predicted transcriptional regulator